MAQSASITAVDVQKAMAEIDRCCQRMNEACNRSCNETNSNVGTTMIGTFASSTSHAAGRVQECKNTLCADGESFKEALRGTRNTLSAADEDMATPVNAIDPFAGGMGNYARL